VNLTAPRLASSLLLLALSVALPTAWAADEGSPPVASSAPPVHRALDLTPPDIRKVIPPEQLNAPLPNPDEEPQANAPEVQVRGSRSVPDVPGGIVSVFWAVRHPTQAWRILMPVQ